MPGWLPACLPPPDVFSVQFVLVPTPNLTILYEILLFPSVGSSRILIDELSVYCQPHTTFLCQEKNLSKEHFRFCDILEQKLVRLLFCDLL